MYKTNSINIYVEQFRIFLNIWNVTAKDIAISYENVDKGILLDHC